MATLRGKITDVTHKPPESLSSITVKAPSVRVGGGTDLIVSSPATVDFDRDTGDVTISGLTGGLSWLYLEGEGWSDSIPLAVAEGMIALVEAIANAAGAPGMRDYVRLLAKLELAVGEVAQDAVDAAAEGIKWIKRNLATGEDLNTVIEPGIYTARTHTLAMSLVNRPTLSLAVERGSLEVLDSGTGAIHQTWTAMQLASRESPIMRRWRDNGGTWSEWVRIDRLSALDVAEIDQKITDSKWLRANLVDGTDLNAVTATGVHYFTTHTVSSSLVNSPSNWVPQPGWVEVVNSGQVVFQKLHVWDSNFISSWERVRLGTEWQPWAQTMYRGVPPKPWAQADDVIFWGDSLVDGGDENGQWETGENLPGQLSSHLSNKVVNRGRSGQTSNEILIRSGAVEIWGTPVGGKTVPGGYVDIAVNGQTPLSRTGRTFAATWGGASGTLKSKGSGWEFYQPSGAAATITSPTKVNATQAFPHERSTHIFLMGENDFWTGDLAPDGDIVDHVVANYQRAVESIPEDPVRHVLIGGVKCKADTVKGDERYRQVKEINRRLAALFPANFVDREAWLSSRALDAAGITPTESDLEAMAANITPPSAFASGDNLHIRKEVVSAEARELWLPALIHRGWAQAKDGVSTPAPFGTFSVDLWANRDDLDNKSDKGHVHTADQITDLHHYRGTGSPEGKVAAPVGSVYTDTAATNGAIRWIKTSGTGNTGWRVEYGDTGWRDITALMGDSVTGGKALIRRKNGTVWLDIDSLTFPKTPSYLLFSASAIPLGFRVVSGWKYFNPTSRHAAGSQGPLRTSYGGDLGLYDTTDKTDLVAYVSWTTENGWPATLPGAPA